MTAEEGQGATDYRGLALAKMSKVLGQERADRVARKVLADLGIELNSPDELHEFAKAVAALPGFEGAVGAMLSVEAVLHGAGTGGGSRRAARPG